MVMYKYCTDTYGDTDDYYKYLCMFTTSKIGYFENIRYTNEPKSKTQQ